MRKLYRAAIMLPLILGACSASQVTAVEAAIKANAAKVTAICNNDVLPVAQSTAADLLAMSVPYVAQAQASAVGACNAIDTVAQSASTGAWLLDQITIMKTKGAVLPPPVAPAPITATTVGTSAQ